MSYLRIRNSKRYGCTVAGLLIIHAALAISSVGKKSAAFDEILHLTGGYSYWRTNDYRLHPENGIFPQRWASLPLLVSDITFPSLEQPAWWNSAAGRISHEFFYMLGNDVQHMLLCGRCMIVLLSVLLGWIVYRWSRHLFGDTGGLLSLAMYAFSPTILAHARLATSDMAVALGFIASLSCLWFVMHRVSLASVAVSGATLGLLILAKMSAVIIFPVAALLWILREWMRRPLCWEFKGQKWIVDRTKRQVIGGILLTSHILLCLVLVWMFFGFRFSTFRTSQPGRDRMRADHTIEGIDSEGLVGVVADMAHRFGLVPEAYLQGFCFVVRRAKERPAFLQGEYSQRGWGRFFPYCLLVKTPIPLLALVLLGVGTVVWRGFVAAPSYANDSLQPQLRPRGWKSVRRVLYRGAPLWVFFVVYWFLAIQSSLNIGHRHLLPTYPVMFVAAGASAYLFEHRLKVISVAAWALLVWSIAESLIIWPHYLAYFNRIAGGPEQGYRHLVDSSLDWGQDLPGLRNWLEQERLVDQDQIPVYVSYFGTGDIDYYEISARQLPSYAIWRNKKYGSLTAGVYCISATMLQSVYIGPFGRWRATYEQQYQELLGKEFVFEQFENDRSFRNNVETNQQLYSQIEAHRDRFLELRFARLCAYLRQREPDNHVGYSILIYRLTCDELDQALRGEPTELVPDEAIKPH